MSRRGTVVLWFSMSVAVIQPVSSQPQVRSSSAQPIQHINAPHPTDPRFASGTSWQPASTPHRMLSTVVGPWTFGVHGFVTAVWRNESSRRGDDQTFSTNMMTFMATRSLGRGAITLRAMGSAEPTLGARGYPLLFQTGETADGATPLTDRQHPHDMLMELAALWSMPTSQRTSVFAYAAAIGEPAIGPTPFMHRSSSGPNPVAPISHHFLDATHIANGVITVGVTTNDRVKLEFSAFNGHEPDQKRWNFEAPSLNSYAVRATFNPNTDWSFQASFAELDDPEQLHPGIDVVRITLSASHNMRFRSGTWQSMLAFGRNKSKRTLIPLSIARATFSQPILDHFIGAQELPPLPDDSLTLVFSARVQPAMLFESSFQWKNVGVFTRVEQVKKDELFPPTDLRHSEAFTIRSLTLGAVWTPPFVRTALLSFGVAGTLYGSPSALATAYGSSPRSVMVFGRLDLGASSDH